MKELSIKISYRTRQLRLNMAHKIYYMHDSEYLQENFEKARNKQPHTRNSLRNAIVQNIKENQSKSLYFHGIKDWNSLPNELKTCKYICSPRKE